MDGGRPVWVHNFTLDPEDPQWEGVPLMLCTPQMLPPAARHMGVCHKQVGERMPLVAFALLNRVSPLLTEHFRSLCVQFGLHPERNAKGSLDKHSYVKAVVDHLVPGPQGLGIVEFYSGPPKSGLPDAGCDSALFAACQHLDADNLQEFERLRDKAEMLLASAVDEQNVRPYEVSASRAAEEPGTRAPATASPPHLQRLIPGGGQLSGVHVTERRHLQHFQGFYDRSWSGFARGSHTATWGGRQHLSEVEALCQVINWMRRRHAEATGEAMPSLSLQEAEEAVRASREQRMAQGRAEDQTQEAAGSSASSGLAGAALPVAEAIAAEAGPQGGGRSGRGRGRRSVLYNIALATLCNCVACLTAWLPVAEPSDVASARKPKAGSELRELPLKQICSNFGKE